MLRCTAYETLCMTIWNCNVSLRTNGGTHQWISSDTDGIRCVVPNHRYQGALEAFKDSHVLFKKELRNRVHLVHKDVDAHYMWI